MSEIRQTIVTEYGTPTDHRVDVIRVFQWRELQRILIQAAVNEQPQYGGTWGGQISSRSSSDGVEVTVKIWKEVDNQDQQAH